MSLKTRRRRSKPASLLKKTEFVACTMFNYTNLSRSDDVGQAFQESEEKKAEECRLNTLLDMEIIDLEQIHERAFFTTNNVTIELVLNKNILSWSKVIVDRKLNLLH